MKLKNSKGFVFVTWWCPICWWKMTGEIQRGTDDATMVKSIKHHHGNKPCWKKIRCEVNPDS